MTEHLWKTFYNNFRSIKISHFLCVVKTAFYYRHFSPHNKGHLHNVGTVDSAASFDTRGSGFECVNIYCTFIYWELFVVEKTLNEKRCPVMVDPYLKNYVYNSGSRTRTIVIKRKFTYHQTPTNTTNSSFLAATAQRFDEKMLRLNRRSLFSFLGPSLTN